MPVGTKMVAKSVKHMAKKEAEKQAKAFCKSIETVLVSVPTPLRTIDLIQSIIYENK